MADIPYFISKLLRTVLTIKCSVSSRNCEANRFQFEIGIQSTHAKTLEAIKRPINPQSAALVVKRIREMETIHLHADLILGLPFETKELFYRSLNDIFAMEPHYIQMGLLKLLPGTLFDVKQLQNGYRASRRPPYSVFSNNWLMPTVSGNSSG